MIPYIITFAFLVAGAIFDSRNMEVPVILFPIAGIVTFCVGLDLYGFHIMLPRLMLAAWLFTIFYFLMDTGEIGGADVLAVIPIAFSIGVMAIIAILIIFTIALPYSCYINKDTNELNRKSFPLIPFYALGYGILWFFLF